MENMKNLNDNELNEVAGGGFIDEVFDGAFDRATEGAKAKAVNGSVCTNCGHDVGVVTYYQSLHMAAYRLKCEKCGTAFGHFTRGSDFAYV